MKNIAGIFFLTVWMFSCNSSPTTKSDKVLSENAQLQASLSDSTSWTTIQWLDSSQNFGKVFDGEKVMINFHFKNTGSKPLIIKDVVASCGCTVPEKPNAPIAPGEEGVIKAEFNSAGRVGQASKNITVTCNTAVQTYALHFEGEVQAKK